jgi:DNA polymerase IIIc chi subunit
METKASKVYFLEVKTVQEKLTFLGEAVKEVYFQGKTVLVYSPEKKALEYLDDLLWKQPQQVILPHKIHEGTSDDKIVLCANLEQYQKRDIIVNISSKPIEGDNYPEVIELFDMTSPSKKSNSEQKLKSYQEKGIEPIFLSSFPFFEEDLISN